MRHRHAVMVIVLAFAFILLGFSTAALHAAECGALSKERFLEMVVETERLKREADKIAQEILDAQEAFDAARFLMQTIRLMYLEKRADIVNREREELELVKAQVRRAEAEYRQTEGIFDQAHESLMSTRAEATDLLKNLSAELAVYERELARCPQLEAADSDEDTDPQARR